MIISTHAPSVRTVRRHASPPGTVQTKVQHPKLQHTRSTALCTLHSISYRPSGPHSRPTQVLTMGQRPYPQRQFHRPPDSALWCTECTMRQQRTVFSQGMDGMVSCTLDPDGHCRLCNQAVWGECQNPFSAQALARDSPVHAAGDVHELSELSELSCAATQLCPTQLRHRQLRHSFAAAATMLTIRRLSPPPTPSAGPGGPRRRTSSRRGR